MLLVAPAALHASRNGPTRRVLDGKQPWPSTAGRDRPGRHVRVLGLVGRVCRALWGSVDGIRGHQRAHREDDQGPVPSSGYAEKGNVVVSGLCAGIPTTLS